jgi:hypothetical protein
MNKKTKLSSYQREQKSNGRLLISAAIVVVAVGGLFFAVAYFSTYGF